MRSIRDVMPLYLPTIPFSLVLGVAITESAMPTAIGYSSNLMFAGASQLATVTLAGTATWLTLVITASVINLRHVMYSAAMSVHFRDQPTWFRWVGSFVLIDQMFALTVNRTDLAPNVWRRYYMGAGVFLLVAWIVGVTVGMAVGSAIPTEWRLDVTPAVMFGGLVVMGISTRPAAAAAITGAAVCFACLEHPEQRRHPARCHRRRDRRLPHRPGERDSPPPEGRRRERRSPRSPPSWSSRSSPTRHVPV